MLNLKKNHKKLCFIIPKVYPLFNNNIDSTFGGAEKQAYLLGKVLSNIKNFEINYIVNDYDQKQFERFGKINIYNTFSFKDNILVSFKNILKKVQEINPDYCIFRGDNKKIFFLAIILKFFLKKKYIFWISHDSLVRKRLILNSLFFRNAFCIITQTSDQKALLKKNYKLNSILIRNIFMKNKDVVNKKNKRDIILWVGRSENWKRPEIFINLAKKNLDEKFVMIMSTATNKERYFNKIKALANRQQNILFLTNLKFYEITSYYKQSKIFVITSEEEGFSNTMMEAMEYDCPILSLKVDPDGILKKYNLGLCAEDKIDLFYNYFKYLNNDSKIRKLYQENSRKYLEKYHDANIIAKNFINIL